MVDEPSLGGQVDCPPTGVILVDLGIDEPHTLHLSKIGPHPLRRVEPERLVITRRARPAEIGEVVEQLPLMT